MSTTPAVEDRSSAVLEHGAVTSRPTTDEVIEAILDEARAKGVRCDLPKAQRVYDLLDKAARWGRRYKQPFHLTEEVWNDIHNVLEAIMPDNQLARANSAHALANANLLDAARGELGFVHVNRLANRAEYTDCAVEIDTRTAPV